MICLVNINFKVEEMMKLTKFTIAITVLSFFVLFTNAFAGDDYKFDPKSPYHTLYVPEGKGPFPAILLLHASGGVAKVNHDWAQRLKEHGYVVFVIDSFKPRGWVDRASVGWEKATAAQLSDIAPAYRYLMHLPNVNPDKIGLLGFSMGGFDVLSAMQIPTATPADYQLLPFKAAASFYGVCHRLPDDTKLKGPTKLFIGSDDDRATTDDCTKLVARSGGEIKQITMHIYQNALHGFDNFEFPESKEIIDEKGERYHIGYNESAREESLKDLPAFFDKYLR